MEICGVAISNVLSLVTCFLELMFYSGTVWGFSFLEYIFKEEKIFEKEKCENVDPAGNFKIFTLDFEKFWYEILTIPVEIERLGTCNSSFRTISCKFVLSTCTLLTFKSYITVSLIQYL